MMLVVVGGCWFFSTGFCCVGVGGRAEYNALPNFEPDRFVLVGEVDHDTCVVITLFDCSRCAVYPRGALAAISLHGAIDGDSAVGFFAVSGDVGVGNSGGWFVIVMIELSALCGGEK
jgi:hypothetical protein